MKNNSETRWHKTLLSGGIFLIALGIFHVFVQIIMPRDWESLIGWRKPILFGLSTGITLVSLAWVAGIVLKNRAYLITNVIAIFAVAEVLIITVQTWRGVPAHFNNGGLTDRILTDSIDAMLVFITLGIFYLTIQTLKFSDLEADWLLAIRLGMIYLAFGCLLGFGVAIYGNYMLSIGGNPELVNPRGVPKFVHGMPLHTIQILPIWLFFIGFFNDDIKQRQISLKFAALTIALTTIYALWQTLNGFGRFDVNLTGILLLGMVGLSALATIFYGLVTRKRNSV